MSTSELWALMCGFVIGLAFAYFIAALAWHVVFERRSGDAER